jgi:hypothetical protein
MPTLATKRQYATRTRTKADTASLFIRVLRVDRMASPRRLGPGHRTRVRAILALHVCLRDGAQACAAAYQVPGRRCVTVTVTVTGTPPATVTSRADGGAGGPQAAEDEMHHDVTVHVPVPPDSDDSAQPPRRLRVASSHGAPFKFEQ